MKTLLVVLIHNNDNDRLKNTRLSIDMLLKTIDNGLDAKYIEICYQPSIEHHSVIVSFLREFHYSILYLNWCNYCLNSISYTHFWFKTFIAMANKYVIDFKKRERWQRSSMVEQFVTSKHIRAWELFVANNFDYLLVFEDDVYFKNNSVEKFNSSILNVINNNHDNLLYCDLAGGCDLNDLKINNLYISDINGFSTYKKPVTNTACCYLLSFDLAKHFVGEIIKNPLLRTIGIDWLMNKLFIILDRYSRKCTCFHANPTVFEHGSATGRYMPWQR